MKKRQLGFGWGLLVISLFVGITYVWSGGFTSSQSLATYDIYNSKVHATLRVKELTADTMKGTEAGTTSATDMHGYVKFVTFLRVHEYDADTGRAFVEAQVSVDGSNWVRADTLTVRTTDSTWYEIEWTLPPALYFRVIWTAEQNTVDSTQIDHVYHIFQQ